MFWSKKKTAKEKFEDLKPDFRRFQDRCIYLKLGTEAARETNDETLFYNCLYKVLDYTREEAECHFRGR